MSARYSRFPLFAVLTALLTIGTPSGAQAGPAKHPVSVYVSPRGDDSAPGTKGKPFRTLVRARDAIRAAGKGPGRILLRDGVYYETALELGPGDSGLTIEAARGEKPVLSGGRKVRNWERDGDFLAARLEGVREGAWDFRSLTVNGALRERARLPETGKFTHESVFDVRWMSSTAGGWERKPTPEELTTMKYRAGDLGGWLDVKNAEITVYHLWDESVVGLKSLDENTRTLTFSIPSGHPPGAFGTGNEKARKYVVWNVREGMTRPGQWYLDRTRGMLVYYPLPGENASTLTAVAPVARSVIRLADGARDITIRGIIITGTTAELVTGGFGAGNYSGAIQGEGLRACRFEDLVLENIGGWGVKLGGDSLRVARCTIRNAGAGGVQVRGTDIEVVGNHVHDIGRSFPSAIAIWGLGGERHHIARNHLHHTPYTALYGAGSGSLIEANRFHDNMLVLDDGAAIYVGFCHDTVIRGNVVRGNRGEAGPAHAYYLDEQAENCIVEGNLAVDTSWPSHNHMTGNCIIRNNVFVDRGPQQITFPRSGGLRFERNILVAEEITFGGPADGLVSRANNIIHSRSGKVSFRETAPDYSTTKTGPFVPVEGTVFADPRLEGADRESIRFRTGSPAPGLGITPIDVRGAGKWTKGR